MSHNHEAKHQLKKEYKIHLQQSIYDTLNWKIPLKVYYEKKKKSLLKLTFSNICAIMLRAVILCDCRELLARRKSSSREYPGTCIKIYKVK